MAMINLAHFIPCSVSEGPGKRAVIWVQGCHLDCEGCCNPELQSFRPATLCDIEELIEKIVEAKRNHDIEGITLLGGEPMLQAQGLALLAEACQSFKLSVMIFTGFTLNMLKQQSLLGSERLLNATDLLVDGPYLRRKPETERNWCGSTNQQFHYLTDRYQPSIETDPRFQPSIEVGVSLEQVRISGYPS
ncbi:4Fe-4S single cluster domain-containing protein [Vibrio rotiferianus]|uniref:4Fe-4S single cluster domain-containing protein n=1 Tax=Vibrio rotiferianus TaxID=190895 RepID=UPI0038B2C54A